MLSIFYFYEILKTELYSYYIRYIVQFFIYIITFLLR